MSVSPSVSPGTPPIRRARHSTLSARGWEQPPCRFGGASLYDCTTAQHFSRIQSSRPKDASLGNVFSQSMHRSYAFLLHHTPLNACNRGRVHSPARDVAVVRATNQSTRGRSPGQGPGAAGAVRLGIQPVRPSVRQFPRASSLPQPPTSHKLGTNRPTDGQTDRQQIRAQATPPWGTFVRLLTPSEVPGRIESRTVRHRTALTSSVACAAGTRGIPQRDVTTTTTATTTIATITTTTTTKLHFMLEQGF